MNNMAYHPSTHSLGIALELQAIKNPLTDAPFSEAMLMGIGGGLGAGYILWEFQAHETASIVLGFQYRWNYTTELINNAVHHLGGQSIIKETGGQKSALHHLLKSLEEQKPVLVWVDKASLPYQHLPVSLIGHANHIITVLDQQADTFIVADLAQAPYEISAVSLAQARHQIPSNKNRSLSIIPPRHIDLPFAIRQGIAKCVEHLTKDSDSFSIPVYKKWASLMTNNRKRKAWPNVFKNPNGLYQTLRSVYEGITLDQTEGYALRQVYADFLAESATYLNQEAYQVASQHYHQLALEWQKLADIAFPPEVAAFKESREALQGRYAAFRKNDEDSLQKHSSTLERLMKQYNHAFPLDTSETTSLFRAMQDQLEKLYEAETEALQQLKILLED